MKRVNYEVAKALKDAGYPQDWDNTNARYILKDFRIVTSWYREGLFLDDEELTFSNCAIAPTYLEVWLWLWREKKISIELLILTSGNVCALSQYIPCEEEYSDPEEAIEKAIEYLVTNDLIK